MCDIHESGLEIRVNPPSFSSRVTLGKVHPPQLSAQPPSMLNLKAWDPTLSRIIPQNITHFTTYSRQIYR